MENYQKDSFENNEEESEETTNDYFVIDPYDLEKEWTQQTILFRKHGYLLANARDDYERKKARRELVKAELDRAIRLDPGKYNIDKLTEPRIENTIIIQKEYQEANKEFLDAKHFMDVKEVEVDVLEQKKKGLENAVQLLLSNLWSEPRLKGNRNLTRMAKTPRVKPNLKRPEELL